MSFVIPNIAPISLQHPKLGEALTKMATVLNNNVSKAQQSGNRKAAPPLSLVNPTVRPG